MTRVAALVALAALSPLACFAHYAGTPLEIEATEIPPGHERKLVIGVQEPEIKLDPPIFEGARPESWTSLGDLNRSISLIRSMRASGLYREVDFERQLTCEPDFVIEVEKNPILAACDADASWLLFYMGVVPVWYTCDHGHYFSQRDGNHQRFQFPWHETELFGWFMPVLNLFPGWTWKRPDPDRLYDVFRAFLLSHESELLAGVEPKVRAPCSAN